MKVVLYNGCKMVVASSSKGSSFDVLNYDTYCSTEMVQVTPLRRTLASSP